MLMMLVLESWIPRCNFHTSHPDPFAKNSVFSLHGRHRTSRVEAVIGRSLIGADGPQLSRVRIATSSNRLAMRRCNRANRTGGAPAI